ncbi:MAG: protoporphyrinogen oxidase [Candidatus Lindowbacteria bacterium]|nr:protoporphyrinogen oxidase [Candidatus Lindowbacteria bacterium]
MKNVCIIGGGIAGLTAAFKLSSQNCKFTLLESSERAGGVIGSSTDQGFLVERGPNSFLNTSANLEEMINSLGLESQRISPSKDASNRFIVKRRKPIALPRGPINFLSTPLFSSLAKARIVAEPFTSNSTDDNESVSDFIKRRLGKEVLNYAVEPFVAGIYAGNPDLLCMKHAFPKLHKMVKENGSILAGILNRISHPGRPHGVFGFKNGMHEFISALQDLFKNNVRYNSRGLAIEPTNGQWLVRWDENGDNTEEVFDAVILSVPLHQLRKFDAPQGLMDSFLEIGKLRYAPISVVAMGYRREQVRHPLDGFGMLVPRCEPFNILGTLFSSSLFPNRAPEGHVLITSFIGGERAPEHLNLEDSSMEYLVQEDLRVLLGAIGTPRFKKVVRYTQAIPQYESDYSGVKETIKNIENTHAGLYLAGSFRSGISVPDTVDSTVDIIEKVEEYLDL